MSQKIQELINKLEATGAEWKGKDYLRTWKMTQAQVEAVFYTARCLEEMYKENIDCKVFNSGLAVSNFRDNSTRTRFSFASACQLLGLTVNDLDEAKSQISHGETVRETANMISFLTEVIGIRDDLYIHEGHKYQTEVATAVQQGFDEGVLPQRPVLVNLQCDQDHPTQSMSDLLHIASLYGGLEGVKGKKIAVTWAMSPAYGKPLSVPQSLITLLPRFGAEVRLAHPEGYGLLPEIVDEAKKCAELGGGKFTQVATMAEAFKDADVVYPKSWAPFHVMERRVKLLREEDSKTKLAALEKECLANNAKHLDWECTEELMALTNGGKAHYMHCLPADITGLNAVNGEVALSVFERYRKETYDEASHKPYVIASAILLGKFDSVPETLRALCKRNTQRVFKA